MRFCDFFVEYKLRMKSVNSVIRYDEQPRYRLALFGLFIIFATLFAIFAVSNVIFDDMFTVYMGVSAVGMFIIIVIMGILDSIRKNKERLLEEIRKPYSARRMNVFIQLL
ncbi:hypothetical protein [Butyrivibrio sp. INlla16]|uniref:hypothetical protein n=1 Tax=Butyrivibrio sp. INlla16 TaxID=1520807 RepID=UPI000882379E|nr:hypothetical protein [Butyrivibrio sp. INlla16]SDB68479.1 hypothetical protein SAMN02910263_04202 [Butyrivibrio sp. INlla16]